MKNYKETRTLVIMTRAEADRIIDGMSFDKYSEMGIRRNETSGSDLSVISVRSEWARALLDLLK